MSLVPEETQLFLVRPTEAGRRALCSSPRARVTAAVAAEKAATKAPNLEPVAMPRATMRLRPMRCFHACAHPRQNPHDAARPVFGGRGMKVKVFSTPNGVSSAFVSVSANLQAPQCFQRAVHGPLAATEAGHLPCTAIMTRSSSLLSSPGIS